MMKSPSFEVAQKVGTIVLGKIVVDEVCNKYRENLEEKATKTRRENGSSILETDCYREGDDENKILRAIR